MLFMACLCMCVCGGSRCPSKSAVQALAASSYCPRVVSIGAVLFLVTKISKSLPNTQDISALRPRRSVLRADRESVIVLVQAVSRR